LAKIRVCLAYRGDVRKVLFKIKESDVYKRFLRQFHCLKAKYEIEITLKDVIELERLELDIMDRIQTELIKDYLVKRILYPHRSRKNPGYYRKTAISRVKRFVRVLLHNTLQIMPEYYEFLERKLEELIEDLTQNRIL